MTVMAVVDVVGVNPSGQASSRSPVHSTKSDLLANGEFCLPVIAMIFKEGTSLFG